MKRKMCSLILAIVTFIAVYMIMSFAIPGFRIKLEAEPAVVFVETLKILWPFKAAVSPDRGGTHRRPAVCFSEAKMKKRPRHSLVPGAWYIPLLFFLSMGLPSMPTGPLPLMAR